MWILDAVNGLVSGLAKPVTDLFIKKEERRIAQSTINGQVDLAKLDNQASVNIGITDWERLSKANESGTWKDEYVTLSVFSLFNVIVIGAIASGLGLPFGPELLEGVKIAIAELNQIDGIVAKLLWMTAAAALSIKTINAVR